MTTQSDKLPRPFRHIHAADNDRSDSMPAATSGGNVSLEPVVVWEAANRMEAQIVKGRLESAGIPAIIRGEIVGSIYGLTTGGLAATDVLVPAPLADQALELLHSEVEWDEADFDGDVGPDDQIDAENES